MSLIILFAYFKLFLLEVVLSISILQVVDAMSPKPSLQK